MSDGLASFEIRTNVLGQGEVIVNGESIHPKALSFHAQVGQPSVLQLRMPAGGEIRGEGIVQLELAEQAEKEAVKAFLKTCSPGELDEAVCARMEWESGSPMALALAVLWDWADGIH